LFKNTPAYFLGIEELEETILGRVMHAMKVVRNIKVSSCDFVTIGYEVQWLACFCSKCDVNGSVTPL
jgi:hypothetical protein